MDEVTNQGAPMRLDGIHHITAITGDAPRNVDFYGRVLGLRLVKKTVNQDDPTVYHLFYADERGSPGSDITFFEYPGAREGSAGAGMVHRIAWRVASEDAPHFLAGGLEGGGFAGWEVRGEQRGSSYVFDDAPGPGVGGAGTVHHVAWSSPFDEHAAWRERVL